MGNKSKRSHWAKKRRTVCGVVVQYKRLVRGHGFTEQKPEKEKPLPRSGERNG